MLSSALLITASPFFFSLFFPDCHSPSYWQTVQSPFSQTAPSILRPAHKYSLKRWCNTLWGEASALKQIRLKRVRNTGLRLPWGARGNPCSEMKSHKPELISPALRKHTHTHWINHISGPSRGILWPHLVTGRRRCCRWACRLSTWCMAQSSCWDICHTYSTKWHYHGVRCSCKTEDDQLWLKDIYLIQHFL